MTRHFCDRCGEEISDWPLGSVDVVEQADERGDGTVSARWDVCVACIEALAKFMSDGKRVSYVRAEVGR